MQGDDGVTFSTPGKSFCCFNLQGAKVAVHNDVKFFWITDRVGFRSFQNVGDKTPHARNQIVEDFLSSSGVAFHAVSLCLGLELAHGENGGVAFCLWSHECIPQ